MSKKKQGFVHPIDVLVGKKIKEFRVRHDKSQKSLGDEVGLTFQQIQKYESGKNRVSASILFEISKVLRTPIAQFFLGTDHLFGRGAEVLSDSGESSYIADEKEILELFSSIRDQKVKESVIILLRNLTNL